MTPGMDWEKFDRMKAILDAVEAYPLIGIVPDSHDAKLSIDPERGDFWERMRGLEEEGWTIALHGWHHVYTTKEGGMFPLNRQSEFAGLSYERQRVMIGEGRQILEDHGILTDIFMAPSHSYDRNTLRALRDEGFKKMTDGFGKTPYIYDGITFYPISVDRKRSLADESDAATTFVYHCNTMTDADFAAAEKVLRSHDILPYREYLYYPAKERGAMGRAGEYLLALAKCTAVSLRKRG